MRKFFLGQMDYIFFIYGLAFILLFAVTVSIQKQRKTDIPWYLLGLFGLVHGVNEWLDMLTFSFGSGALFDAARVIIMAMSFLLLFEFGRLTCLRFKYINIGRWIYIPLFFVVFSGCWAGLSGANAAARYSFGLTGGLLAALALWRISRERGVGGKALLSASVSLALYSVAAGLVVPKALILSASVINHDSFLKLFGFPVQLLRAFAASLTAMAVWAYHENIRAENRKERSDRTDRRLFMGAVLALCFVTLLGWSWTDRSGEREKASERARRAAIAQQLYPDVIKDLSASAGDK